MQPANAPTTVDPTTSSAQSPCGDAQVEWLTTVAMLASLHFAISYVSVLVRSVLAALLGPATDWIMGLADQGVQGMLLAVALVLFPRVGTATALMLTAYLLNGIFSGTLNVSSVLMIAASVAIHEVVLAAAGASRASDLQQPGVVPPTAIWIRTALAIGTCKALSALVQYLIYMYMLRLFYPTWFVVTSAVLTGLGYASIGGAWGVWLGYRLRRGAL